MDGDLNDSVGKLIGPTEEGEAERYVKLPKGTLLRSKAEGPVVGRVIHDMEGRFLVEQGGWRKLAIGTRLAELSIWVSAD